MAPNDPPPTAPEDDLVWVEEQLRMRIARRPRNAPDGQSSSQGAAEPSNDAGNVQETSKISKGEGADKLALDQSSDASKRVQPIKYVLPKTPPEYTLVNRERIPKATPKFVKQMYAMAAFLNFDDRRDFHKLQFSPPFLLAYRIWLDYSARGKEYLRYLADEPQVHLESGPLGSFKWPNSFKMVRAQYPVADLVEPRTRNINFSYGLASVILIVSRCLKEYSSFTDKKKKRLDIQGRKEFGEVIEQKLPQHFDPVEITKLEMGPFEGEEILDRMRRINFVFHSIKYFTSATKWTDYKLSDTAACTIFSDSKPVHADWSPPWMLPRDVELAAEEPTHVLPVKRFKVKWLRSAGTEKEKSAMQAHIDGYIEDGELKLLPEESELQLDPRYCVNGEQWRDCVRDQYNLFTLRLDLRVLYLVNNKGERKCIYGRETSLNWKQAMAIFRDEDVSLQMKLGVGREGTDIKREYRGLPPTLSNYMEQRPDNSIEFALRNASPKTTVHGEGQGAGEEEKEARDGNARERDVSAAKKRAILSGHTIKVPKRPTDIKAFLSYHEGHDVGTAEGLEAWLDLLLGDEGVCDPVAPRIMQQDATNATGLDNIGVKITKEHREFLDEFDRKTRDAGLQEDNDGFGDAETTLVKSSLLRLVQDGFTGAHGSTGPPVEDCRLVLGMKPAGFWKKTSVPVFTCSLLPNCKVRFLDTQITGAVWLLQRTLGFVPRFVGLHDQLYDSARARLRSIAIKGCIFADMTGLGKTYTTCLAITLLLQAIKNGEVLIPSGQCMPSLLIAPSGVVLKQWYKAIKEDFPEISVLVSATVPDNSGIPSNCKLSTAAIKDPDTQFPNNLKYVLNQNDPKAFNTIILTLPDTHSARTMLAPDVKLAPTTKQKKSSKARKNSPHAPKPKRGQGGPKKRASRRKTDFTKYVSSWEGRILVCIFDEAHKLRHNYTKLSLSVRKLRARYLWFITASPMVNDAKDIIGLLSLIWDQALQTLKDDQTAFAWYEKTTGGWDLIQEAAKFPDRRRIACIEPRAVTRLLITDQISIIQQNFRHVSDTILLRRSAGSKLRMREGSNETLDLSQMMQPHIVWTVDLKYKESEKQESQYWHLLAASSYNAAIQNSIPGKASKSNPKDRKSFPAIIGPLRKLAIATASTKLARLDHELEALGYSSLVQDMDGYRSVNHGLSWMIRLIHQDVEGERPKTRRAEIKYMLDGSPLGRYFFTQVRDYVRGQKQKLLAIEDIPLSGWLWETLLKWAYIDVTVLYSSTSMADRQKAVESFNDPKSELQVLILLYNVGGAQGTNLDKCCTRAIVLMPAINSMLEIQAWGRIIRVSQDGVAWIIRPKIKNSHMEWRDSRQMDKSIVELACRTSIHPDVEDLLLSLLRKYHFEIVDAHTKFDGFQPDKREGFKSKPLESGEPAPESSNASAPTSPRGGDDADSQYELSNREDEGSNYSDSESSSDSDDDDEEETYDDPYVERTFIAAKEAYRGLSLQSKQQFDHDRLNLELLLKFDRQAKYNKGDLVNKHVFERALQLLYRERYGVKDLEIRVGPHVKYTKLSADIVNQYKQRNILGYVDLTRKAKEAKLNVNKVPKPKGRGKATAKRVSESDISFFEKEKKKRKTETGEDDVSVKAEDGGDGGSRAEYDLGIQEFQDQNWSDVEDADNRHYLSGGDA